jgi:hypothetical protein
MAKPEERDPESFTVFKETGHDLERLVIDSRPQLVAAALTIIRAYIVAGRPKMGLKSIDFPAWSGLIRQAVAWSYDFDPAGSRDRLEAEDETSANRLRLVVAWGMLCEAIDADSAETDDSKKAINRGLTTSEAAAKLDDFHDRKVHPEVVQAFATFAPKGKATPDATRLGLALRKENGAPTECGTLTHGPLKRGSPWWFVEKWTPPKED